MNSYNDVIVTKIAEYISHIADRLGSRDDKGRSVKMTKYQLLEEGDQTLDKYTSTGDTAVFTILFEFDIIHPDGNIEKVSEELKVPKMVNNLFVIGGKLRVPTSVLNNDYICRIYDDRIVIDSDLSIKLYKEGNTLITYELELYSDDIEYQKVFYAPSNDNYEKLRDKLKLSREVQLKLQVMLDVDSVGDYLTDDLVSRLVKLPLSKYEDSIINKRIYTVVDNLMYSLYRRSTKSEILRSMRKKFHNQGGIYFKDISNNILMYFRLSGEDSLEIPSKINPLVYDSLRNKITIPPYIAYHRSYTDLIDVVNTPQNNSVNRINELNKCCKLINGELHIECYDYKTGDKITVLYMEYLNSKVLMNHLYDYDNKELLESEEYSYKLRLNTYHTKDITSVDLDYIEPAPDEKLSITTRQLPLIDKSDSVRVGMGIGMEKQAIELHNSEPRLVYSGNEDEDLKDSASVIKYHLKDPAVVTKITDTKVFYKLKDTGSLGYYEILEPSVGINNTMITYVPNVEVGEELLEGKIVVSPKIMSRGTYELGLNTLVFYMSYLGYTYEDGVVVSESYAKRAAHYTSYNIFTKVRKTDILNFIVKVGTEVQSQDVLVTMQSELRGRSKLNEAYLGKGIMSPLGLNRSANNSVVPNNINKGYVVDVKIFKNPDSRVNCEYTTKLLEEYDPTDVSSEYMVLPEVYRKSKAEEAIVESGFEYVISIRLISMNLMDTRSKVCNSWGSKGEIALVVPDDKMPYRKSDGRRADMILNPAAVVHRKNPSQLYEVVLTKLMRAIYDNMEVMLPHEGDYEAMQNYLKTYYGNKFKNYSLEELRNNHKKGLQGYRMKVGSYSKITLEQLFKWMEDEGISESDVVIDPELGEIESPIITGESYMMKLYHSADFSGKVTSSVRDSKEPYMGKGIYRSEGQKIGEMELWSLMSHGTDNFVASDPSESMKSQFNFLNELLMAGYVMSDSEGLPFLSNYRGKLMELKELTKDNK